MATNSKQGSFWPTWDDNKLFSVLLAIVLVYGTVWLFVSIQKTMNEAQHVGIADQMAPTISVTGKGSASRVPDMAKVDLTVATQAASTQLAQDGSSDMMTALVAKLRELGVADVDMKTANYVVAPMYNYDVSPAAITGYDASQTITITIHDTAKTDGILQAAGELGVARIGDVQLTVADDTAILAEARAAAIANAYTQAVDIARAMGQDLGGPVNYYESQGGYYPYVSAAYDVGGEKSMVQILEGQNEVETNVTVTYSIK